MLEFMFGTTPVSNIYLCTPHALAMLNTTTDMQHVNHMLLHFVQTQSDAFISTLGSCVSSSKLAGFVAETLAVQVLYSHEWDQIAAA